MTALTAQELLAWVQRTSDGWRALIASHPEVLLLPCDIRETHSVAELLQHIVAVELRYAELLCDLPQSDYTQIPFGTGDELFGTHDQAMALLHDLLARPDFAWDDPIEFSTRSAGTLRAPRRVILVHLLTHSIRHYAQLGTLVRQHGMQPGWSMDYLFMEAKPAV